MWASPTARCGRCCTSGSAWWTSAARTTRAIARVNRHFAESLLPLLRADDLIWVHDYHLIPLAAELRALGVRNRIGFFLHTPFVPPAMFHALPRAAELLQAMCAFDVVGLPYRRPIARVPRLCAEILRRSPASATARFTHGGRHVVRSSIRSASTPTRFADTAARADTRRRDRAAARKPGRRTLAIGVDRLDYSKGLRQNGSRRSAASWRSIPQHRRQVSFLQIAAPSREESRAIRVCGASSIASSGEINGALRRARLGADPLHDHRTIAAAPLAGFYRSSRIGW